MHWGQGRGLCLLGHMAGSWVHTTSLTVTLCGKDQLLILQMKKLSSERGDLHWRTSRPASPLSCIASSLALSIS